MFKVMKNINNIMRERKKEYQKFSFRFPKIQTVELVWPPAMNG